MKDFSGGGLVVCGIPATVDESTREAIAAAGFAGHVLFRRNATDARSVAELCSWLTDQTPPVDPPPVLAIDEEGGFVSRLNHLGLDAPAALAIGATGSPDRAREVAREVGRALAALGLNTVFAPCLDVLIEPLNPVIATRAYGDQAEPVGALGHAAIAGFRSAAIEPVVKHFPGHGATRADSHLALPVVRRSAAELASCELGPFMTAFRAGARAVMTAHVAYPEATPVGEKERPATYSQHWLGRVLRSELGFTGLVLSDALEMAGASTSGDPAAAPDAAIDLETRVEHSVRAGVDLLLFDELENGLRAAAHLETLAADSRWRKRLGEALTRVTGFRRQLKRHPAAADPQAALQLGSGLFSKIQEQAIALVGDPGSNLPLARDRPLCFALPRALDPNRRLDLEWFASRLNERFPRARVLPLEPGKEGGQEVASAPRREPETLILGCLGRGSNGWIREMAGRAGDGPGGRIGVALHRPVEVLELPESWTRLVSYGFGRVALGAVVDILAGVAAPRGAVLGLGDLMSGAREV